MSEILLVDVSDHHKKLMTSARDLVAQTMQKAQARYINTSMTTAQRNQPQSWRLGTHQVPAGGDQMVAQVVSAVAWITLGHRQVCYRCSLCTVLLRLGCSTLSQ